MHLLAFAENIFFLVLVAAVGLIRWLMQASEARKNSESERRTQPPPPNAPVPRPETQTEEERVRRFMEALGVPTSTAPPPKMREVIPKKTRPAQRKVYPVDPFPKPRSGPWSPEPVKAPPSTPAAPPPIPSTPPPILETPSLPIASAPPVFEVRVVDGRAEEPRPSSELVRQTAAAVLPQTWAARLSTPTSLRDLVVLREILGAPRSLQPLDLYSLG